MSAFDKRISSTWKSVDDVVFTVTVSIVDEEIPDASYSKSRSTSRPNRSHAPGAAGSTLRIVVVFVPELWAFVPLVRLWASRPRTAARCR